MSCFSPRQLRDFTSPRVCRSWQIAAGNATPAQPKKGRDTLSGAANFPGPQGLRRLLIFSSCCAPVIGESATGRPRVETLDAFNDGDFRPGFDPVFPHRRALCQRISDLRRVESTRIGWGTEILQGTRCLRIGEDADDAEHRHADDLAGTAHA